jgi:hypothetical protein
MEIISDEIRARRNYLKRANSPGNSTLNKRTQPNEKTYVCRLGYNTAANSYTGSSEIGRLSGSSFNRNESKRRKLEREKIYLEAKEAAEKCCHGTYEYDVRKERMESLRVGTCFEPKYKRKLSRSLDRSGKRVHMLSKRSKGKVRDKCTALYRCFKEKGILATLTFVNDVDDKLAVKILNKFLTALRDDKGKVKYIWVAERQMKTTGRIHFHIILDQRMEIEKYNALWILQQYNSGVCHPDYSKSQILDWIEHDKTRSSLEKSELQKRLNPFDVEKIKSMYGLSFYLTKYITKNKSGSFNCLAWHCSRSVSKLFTKTVVSRSTFSQIASKRNFRVSPHTGEVIQARHIKGAFYSLYFIENKYIFLPEMSELEQINCWVLDGMIPDKIPLLDDYTISKFFNN